MPDARAVQRRVVKTVIAVGEVEGKNQGTVNSARKTSARGRNPENFVFVVVVGEGGEEGTVDGIVTRTNPCRQRMGPFVHSHPHDVCLTTYADGRGHGPN